MRHVFSLSNLIKAYRYLKKNGAAAVFSAVQERILQDGKNDWRYQRPDRETLEAQRKDAIASFEAMAFSEAATSLLQNLPFRRKRKARLFCSALPCRLLRPIRFI